MCYFLTIYIFLFLCSGDCVVAKSVIFGGVLWARLKSFFVLFLFFPEKWSMGRSNRVPTLAGLWK